MDWELYERYRATLVLIGVALLCFLLLAFQRTAAVQHLRSMLIVLTLPSERLLSQVSTPAPSGSAPSPASPATDSSGADGHGSAEQMREIQVLTDENRRLHDLLDLKQNRWPTSVGAHVVGRDPQRWFQEIVLDKGKEDGIAVDNPVVVVIGGREGLVGRVTEVGTHVAKVMLIQDSLSAVAASVLSAGAEDGVVEGSNGQDLVLKFLDKSSAIKIGDPIVTTGLGQAFPPGILIGWVQDIVLDPRQLFLQARLRPAARANQLHYVMVLRP